MMDAVNINVDAAAAVQDRDEEEDDNPKRQLISAEDQLPPRSVYVVDYAPLIADAPIWRLKRLRPTCLSIGILAFLTACLTSCAPLVPDLVRELHQPLHQHHYVSPQLLGPSSNRHLISRLLSPRGQCVDIAYASKNLTKPTFRCAYVFASPTEVCNYPPALCRYRAGLFALQVTTPMCLFACVCLLALAACFARQCQLRHRLLLGACTFAYVGLVSTVAFVVCLHSLVAALSATETYLSANSSVRSYYSADSTGTRVAYAALCLQTLLAFQLAFLPFCLRRVAAERAAMLTLIMPIGGQ